MMKGPSTATAICVMMLLPLASLRAQDPICTGPSNLPRAGESGQFCWNERMVLGATGSAPVLGAADMPYQLAVDFARQEAELNARRALAKILNANSVSGGESSSTVGSVSNRGSEWKRSSSNKSAGNVDGPLPPGVAVIAVDTHDSVVYVTLAISAELQTVIETINKR